MDHKKAMKAAFMVAVMASMAFIGMTAASEGASETSETGYGEMTWGSGTDIGSISVEVGKEFSFTKIIRTPTKINYVSVDWVDVVYSNYKLTISGTAPSESGIYKVKIFFEGHQNNIWNEWLTVRVWKVLYEDGLTVGSERLSNNPSWYSGPVTGAFSVAFHICSAGSPNAGAITFGYDSLQFYYHPKIPAPDWVSSITKYESVGQIGGNSGFLITGSVPEGHELEMELIQTPIGYAIRFYADGVPTIPVVSLLSDPSKSGVYEWHGL